MGHRLSKIYTRTGDKGETGLGDGSRVAKDSPRVEAYGTVDELNSAIGIILSHLHALENREQIFSKTISEYLTQIQHELFDMGGELSIPGFEAIHDHHVTALEETLDELNEQLTPLKEFILPGGHLAAAATHLARTICRRAERRLITLMHFEETHSGSHAEPSATSTSSAEPSTELRQPLIKYLNRLSDLLFVIARFINHETNVPEPLWQHERKKN